MCAQGSESAGGGKTGVLDAGSGNGVVPAKVIPGTDSRTAAASGKSDRSFGDFMVWCVVWQRTSHPIALAVPIRNIAHK